MVKVFVFCVSTLVLIGAATGSYALQAQKALPVGTVHIYAFSSFGATIRNATVHLFTPDRKHEFKGPRDASMIPNVPYGQYLVVAFDSGGAVAEREVVVNTKDVWVRIGLAFPAGDRAWPGGDLTISGDLKPPPMNFKDWWVRVDGVFLHVVRESPIIASGQFAVGGLEMGTYLVEVFEGNKLQFADTLQIDTKEANTHMTISLPGASTK